MRAWYPQVGPVFKADVLAVEELFAARRAVTPVRRVEGAMRSPSAPTLLAGHPPMHFVPEMPQVVAFDPAQFQRGTPPRPQVHVPCRQQSAPVLGLQAPATAREGTMQGKEVWVLPPGTPDRTHATPRQASVGYRRPEAFGSTYQPGSASPYPLRPDLMAPAVTPLRQRSAPMPQAQAILRSPEGPWRVPDFKVQEIPRTHSGPQLAAAQTLAATAATPVTPAPAQPVQPTQPVQSAQPMQPMQRIPVASPAPTRSARREPSGKPPERTEGAVEVLLRRSRRQRLLSGCLGAWASEHRRLAREKLQVTVDQCRQFQAEAEEARAAVAERVERAKRAEAELLRRTEEEFRRLRDLQTELLQLQQEAP
ncbi:unnamed protein product, partial [Effrenium voratum]